MRAAHLRTRWVKSLKGGLAIIEPKGFRTHSTLVLILSSIWTEEYCVVLNAFPFLSLKSLRLGLHHEFYAGYFLFLVDYIHNLGEASDPDQIDGSDYKPNRNNLPGYTFD